MSAGLAQDPAAGQIYKNVSFVNKVQAAPLLQSGFPTKPVLDNFNRANGSIGSNWTGYTSAFSISSNRLLANTGGGDTQIYWGNSTFNASQEAYVTIAQVNSDAWELSLMLKSQSNLSYGNGAIEVFYAASTDTLQIWTYDLTNGWVQYGADVTSLVLAAGDQLGTRVLSNGTLEVYRNGSLLATRDLGAWALVDDPGYIGLWFANASGHLLDDFGGGSVSGGVTATPTSTNTPAGPTSTPTGTPTASSLVAAYSFDENAGSTLIDRSGNNHNGTLVNGPTWTAGMYGTALSFDGSNDYVTIGDVDLTGSFTVSFWATADNLTSGCHGSAVMKSLDYGLEICDGYILGQVGTGSTGFDSAMGYTIPQTGVWKYYTLTYDGTTARLYVDGTLSASRARSHGSNNNSLLIGSWDTGSEFYDGLIDEVRIYSRALSQAEIQADMNTPVGGTPAPTATSTPSGPTSTPTRTPTAAATPSATWTPTATQPPAFTGATFVYDGDGNRVAQTINGVTTYFIGGIYEVTGSTVTKYYFAGSQRVAMRRNSTLSYLLADHLGSTSLVVNDVTTGVWANDVVSELRYKPWGEVRYTSGAQQTQYQYTGQYSNMGDFGLMFYNARWYDPYITQFSQPDSIVPDPYNSQDWNRYAYVRYNPLRYTDPSGHICVDGDGVCERPKVIASLFVNLSTSLSKSGLGAQYTYRPSSWGIPSGHYNLCGDIALEMVYGTVTGETNTLDFIRNKEFGHNFSGCFL